MSAELGWTRTADHVRLSRLACHKSPCLAGNSIQLNLSARSGLLIYTGRDGQDDEARGCVDCLAFHLSSSLDSLPTVAKKKKINSFL